MSMSKGLRERMSMEEDDYPPPPGQLSLDKSARRKPGKKPLTWTQWNAKNPKHLKDARGRWGSGGVSVPLEGEDAVKSVPAELNRAPAGRRGNYEGASFKRAPEGHGSAEALAKYEGLEYQDINGLLRGRFQDEFETPKWMTPEEAEEDRARQLKYNAERRAETQPLIDEIDKTMAVSKLPHDIKTQRVIKHGSAVWGNAVWHGEMDLHRTDDFAEQDALYDRWQAGERPDLTGLEWVELAYVSTSASPGFAEHHGRLWVKHVSGMDGEPVIMDITIRAGTGAIVMSEWGEVAEIMTQHGMKARVTLDRGVGPDGFRRMDVEMWPADED